MKDIYLWAKKTDKNGCWEWMSLYQHLVDTRNVAGLLWEFWLSPGQKKVIGKSIGSIDETKCKNLVKFLASVHDIGKATPAFQTKKGFNNSNDLDEFLIERLENQGFKGINNLKLANGDKTPHALSGQFLLNKYGVKDDISSIIGGHHGKPVDDKIFEESQLSYENNYYQSTNECDEISRKWDAVQRCFFEWALYENGYKKVEDLPEISQPGQVLLLGVIIMADWISSNEKFFPLYNLETYSDLDSQSRLRNGWEKWFRTTPLKFNPIFDIDETYINRFGFSPRNFQTVFAETIDEISNPGLIILEAPMGLGKTEAALVGAEQLAYKNDKSGLFIGLPTQATANSIFSRVIPWLRRVNVDMDEKVSIQLQHSKARLNDEYVELATNINIDNREDEVSLNQWFAEKDSMNNVISNGWFSGRKTSILDDFVVGTVDCFLLSALKQKHLALRHLGFSKKVVIIDEVHAYDSYMSEYLERALEWMGAYDVPVILLSATLPAESRWNFVKAYLKGKGSKEKEIKINKEILSTMLYPLITYTEDNEIRVVDKFQPIESKTIKIHRLDKANLYDKISKLITSGGIIGIIVNTVKDAQEIAKKCTELSLKLFNEDIVFMIHAGFVSTERAAKEKQLISLIGKGASRPYRKIIIGTQVMEQSLDIDVDVMISELAPIDLLIQRIGRLHRHDIERPEQHKNPVLYIIGTSDKFEFNEGTQYIYGQYLLAQTQAKLLDKIVIPDDIPRLVQSVYGDTGNSNTSQTIKGMKIDFENEKKLKKYRARTFLLSNPKQERFEYDGEINSLIGWLKDIHPNTSEEYGYAQVRDTQETIEIIALKKYGTGYGFFDETGDISENLDDYEITRKMAASTIKLPLSFSAYGNADKTIKELENYNKKYLPEWQEKILLKGSLGLIFDNNGDVELCNRTLHYNPKYGLSIISEEEFNGQI